MQRTLDILISTVALLLLSPLLLMTALLLRLSGEGEVFFLQERVGKDGKAFKLYKFATMQKNSPNMGLGTITLSNDPRILPLGRILRKTKINEIPQLLNVLKGDMSLVGPRPQTERCFNVFSSIAQTEIIKVRPGLTGIGSIVFRNENMLLKEARFADKFYDEIIMPYKGSLEIWYVKNRSLINYAKTIIVTALVVFGLKINWQKIWSGMPPVPEKLAGRI